MNLPVHETTRFVISIRPSNTNQSWSHSEIHVPAHAVQDSNKPVPTSPCSFIIISIIFYSHENEQPISQRQLNISTARR